MTYTFKNKKTGKILEFEFKISEYDQFVLDHPELERYIDVPPSFVYAGKMFGSLDGGTSDGFKEVLAKIGENNPHSPLADNYRKNKTIKGVKSNEIIKDYTKKSYKKKQQKLVSST
jgi:hypothetical protein